MEETKTVHYVTQDPMAHLKLRVTLTRLSAAKSKVQQQAQVGTSLQACCRARQIRMVSNNLLLLAGNCSRCCCRKQWGSSTKQQQQYRCSISIRNNSRQQNREYTSSFPGVQNVLLAGKGVQQSGAGGSSGELAGDFELQDMLSIGPAITQPLSARCKWLSTQAVYTVLQASDGRRRMHVADVNMCCVLL
jgi:hypothetical protein